VLLLVLLTESEHWILLPISSDEALFSHDFFFSQRQEGKKKQKQKRLGGFPDRSRLFSTLAAGGGSSAASWLAPVHVGGVAKSKRVGDRNPLASGAGAGGSGDPDPHLEASSGVSGPCPPWHCPVRWPEGHVGVFTPALVMGELTLITTRDGTYPSLLLQDLRRLRSIILHVVKKDHRGN